MPGLRFNQNKLLRAFAVLDVFFFSYRPVSFIELDSRCELLSISPVFLGQIIHGRAELVL